MTPPVDATSGSAKAADKKPAASKDTAATAKAESDVKAAEQRESTAKEGEKILKDAEKSLEADADKATDKAKKAEDRAKDAEAKVEELGDPTADAAEATTKRDAAKEKLDKADAEIAKQDEAIAKADDDIKAADKDIESATDDIEAAEKDIKAAEKDIEAAKADIKDAEKRGEKAEADIKAAKDRLASAKERAKAAGDKVASAEAERSRLDAEAASASAAAKADPEDDAAQRRARSARSAAKDAAGRVSTAKQELRAAQQAEAAAQADLEQAEEAKRQADADKLAAEEALQTAEEAKSAAEDAKRAAEAAKAAAEAAKRAAEEAKRNALLAKNLALIEKMQATVELRVAEAALKDAEKRRAEYDKQLKELYSARAEANAARQDADRVRAQLSDKRAQISEASARVAAATLEVTAARAGLTQARQASRNDVTTDDVSTIAGDANGDGMLSEAERTTLASTEQTPDLSQEERDRLVEQQAKLEAAEQAARERYEDVDIDTANIEEWSELEEKVELNTRLRRQSEQEIINERRRYYEQNPYYVDEATGDVQIASVDDSGNLVLRSSASAPASGEAAASSTERTTTIETSRAREIEEVTTTEPRSAGEPVQTDREWIRLDAEGEQERAERSREQVRTNADGSSERSLQMERFGATIVPTERVQEYAKAEANGDKTVDRVTTKLRGDGESVASSIVEHDEVRDGASASRSAQSWFDADGAVTRQLIEESGDGRPTTTADTEYDGGEPATTFITRDGELPEGMPASEYVAWDSNHEPATRIHGGEDTSRGQFESFIADGSQPPMRDVPAEPEFMGEQEWLDKQLEETGERLTKFHYMGALKQWGETEYPGLVARRDEIIARNERETLREVEADYIAGAQDAVEWVRNSGNTFDGSNVPGDLVEPLEPARATPSVFEVPAQLRARAAAAAIDESPYATDPSALARLTVEQDAYEQALDVAADDAERERIMREYFATHDYWVHQPAATQDGEAADPILMASGWSDGVPSSDMFGGGRARDPHAVMARTGIESTDDVGNDSTLDLLRRAYSDGSSDLVIRTQHEGMAGASREVVTGEHVNAAGITTERDSHAQTMVARVEQGLPPLAVTEISRERFDARSGKPSGEQYYAVAQSDATTTMLDERRDTYGSDGIIDDTQAVSTHMSRNFDEQLTGDFLDANAAALQLAHDDAFNPNDDGTRITTPPTGSFLTRSTTDVDYDEDGVAVFQQVDEESTIVRAAGDDNGNGVTVSTTESMRTAGSRNGTAAIFDDEGQLTVAEDVDMTIRSSEYDPDAGTAGGNRSTGHQLRETTEVTMSSRRNPDGSVTNQTVSPVTTRTLREGFDDDWVYDQRQIETRATADGAFEVVTNDDGEPEFIGEHVQHEDLDGADKFEEFMEGWGGKIVGGLAVVAGIAGAVFTGGASLALTAAGVGLASTSLAYSTLNYRQGEGSLRDVALAGAGVALAGMSFVGSARSLAVAGRAAKVGTAATAAGASDDIARAVADDVFTQASRSAAGRTLKGVNTAGLGLDGIDAYDAGQAALRGDFWGAGMMLAAVGGGAAVGRVRGRGTSTSTSVAGMSGTGGSLAAVGGAASVSTPRPTRPTPPDYSALASNPRANGVPAADVWNGADRFDDHVAKHVGDFDPAKYAAIGLELPTTRSGRPITDAASYHERALDYREMAVTGELDAGVTSYSRANGGTMLVNSNTNEVAFIDAAGSIGSLVPKFDVKLREDGTYRRNGNPTTKLEKFVAKELESDEFVYAIRRANETGDAQAMQQALGALSELNPSRHDAIVRELADTPPTMSAAGQSTQVAAASGNVARLEAPLPRDREVVGKLRIGAASAANLRADLFEGSFMPGSSFAPIARGLSLDGRVLVDTLTTREYATVDQVIAANPDVVGRLGGPDAAAADPALLEGASVQVRNASNELEGGWTVADVGPDGRLILEHFERTGMDVGEYLVARQAQDPSFDGRAALQSIIESDPMLLHGRPLRVRRLQSSIEQGHAAHRIDDGWYVTNSTTAADGSPRLQLRKNYYLENLPADVQARLLTDSPDLRPDSVVYEERNGVRVDDVIDLNRARLEGNHGQTPWIDVLQGSPTGPRLGTDRNLSTSPLSARADQAVVNTQAALDYLYARYDYSPTGDRMTLIIDAADAHRNASMTAARNELRIGYHEGGGAAYDPSVIMHELGHKMVDDYTSGMYDEHSAGSIHEGFADVMAAAWTHDPIIGRVFDQQGRQAIRDIQSGEQLLTTRPEWEAVQQARGSVEPHTGSGIVSSVATRLVGDRAQGLLDWSEVGDLYTDALRTGALRREMDFQSFSDSLRIAAAQRYGLNSSQYMHVAASLETAGIALQPSVGSYVSRLGPDGEVQHGFEVIDVHGDGRITMTHPKYGTMLSTTLDLLGAGGRYVDVDAAGRVIETRQGPPAWRAPSNGTATASRGASGSQPTEIPHTSHSSATGGHTIPVALMLEREERRRDQEQQNRLSQWFTRVIR